MSRTTATAVLLLCSLIWGTAFVAQKLAFLPEAGGGGAAERLGPMGFTGWRFVLGTLVVLPLALREAGRAARPLAAARWRQFLLCGLVLLCGAYTQQVGIIGTSVTNSGFLTALYVPLVPAVTLLLFRRAVHWVVWPAAAGCVLGTFLLGGARLDGFSAGDAWVGVGAVFWALQVTLVGIAGAGSGRPFTLAAVQFAVCGALALGLAAMTEPFTVAAALAGGGPLLYAGVLSVGVAFTLQAVGQSRTHPAAAAVIMSSEAVFAALSGMVLLGERPAAVALAGAGVILLCLLAVELVPALWPGQTAPSGISEKDHA